jgi:chromosome partitioning protein
VFVLALMSQKGGAGKSTLALHMATEAASRGAKALLVDLDPQGNLMGWADRRGDQPPDVQALHATQLDRALKSAKADGYDLVVLDTAPSADRVTMVAAKASDLVLVPCRPAQFDLDAVWATLATCDMVRKPAMVVLNQSPTRSRVVPEAAALLASKKAEVTQTIVRMRVAFQHCLIDGRTASEFEPGGAAADEIAALYDEVSARMSADTSARETA